MSGLDAFHKPMGWVKVQVREIVRKVPTTGKKIKQKEYDIEGPYPVIDQGQSYISGYSDRQDCLIEVEDPVIVFGDHTRTVKLVRESFIPGADGVKVLQPITGVTASFLKKVFEFLTIGLVDKGYARHYQHLEKEVFHLPPLEEQRRIVAKIEELFSELDKGVESLQTARARLKTYRQSLLKATFEGRLTEQWRRDNADKLETADQLLQRIREARYRKRLKDWKAAVAKWEADGMLGQKPKKPPEFKPVPDLSAAEQSVLPRAPKHWRYTRLSNVATVGSGMSVSKARQLANPVEVPYLRVANVQRGRLELDGIKHMRIEQSSLDVLRLRQWDILFNEGGDRDKLGRGWVWESQIDPCITQNHVFRATTYLQDEFQAKFISYWGNTFGRSYFEEFGKQTTNLASINKSVLSMFPVPVPPYEELKQIVELLEFTEVQVTALEVQLKVEMKRTDTLRQSILKRAFEGKLVPQNPDDDPASVLLERIRAEQEKAPKSRRRRQKAEA